MLTAASLVVLGGALAGGFVAGLVGFGTAASKAGETLLRTLEPALGSIGGALDDLGRALDTVSGTMRITATRQAYEAVIRPVLPAFCTAHPAATVEVLIECGFRDIIAGRFDVGIRLGEKLQQDMIALSVGPELRMAVVASPSYLADRPVPKTPQDLTQHRCINYRMVAAGTFYAWEFERDGRSLGVGVDGPLTVNEPELMLNAAKGGLGVAYILEHEAGPHIASGELIRVLEDWTPAFPGFFLYYPSRAQMRPALEAFIATPRLVTAQQVPHADPGPRARRCMRSPGRPARRELAASPAATSCCSPSSAASASSPRRRRWTDDGSRHTAHEATAFAQRGRDGRRLGRARPVTGSLGARRLFRRLHDDECRPPTVVG